MSTLENLNTLLSIRLNLHEYDKIPWQFRDYSIKSGRVTFRVAGEFEVDLGIADDDPESQFWFIDFRFLFSPALSELPLPAWKHLEDRVNVVLKDGLLGCYNLLHEMVLTHKISEFRRQAVELARGKWIDTLKVELLNRSVSIQYWVGKEGPKSWIILGVHSGRRKDGRLDPKATSRLSLRWFRSGKEVKDAEIPFDTVTISAITLLKTVIAMHVTSILSSIYEKMQNYPIFAKHEANMALRTSSDEPAESTLKVQLTKSEHVTISMEPITGFFVLSPASQRITQMEGYLNTKRDPASEGHVLIGNLRAMVLLQDIANHGLSAGWMRDTGLKIAPDELKSKLTKNFLQTAFFRRASWLPNWYAAIQLGMDGERWFLLEMYLSPHLDRRQETNCRSLSTPSSASATISASFEMRIKGVSPTPTYSFMSRLNTYAAALIAHFVNLRTLHSLHARHTLQEVTPSSRVRVPYILMRLSELLPSKNKSARTKKPWARDSVKLIFQGLEPAAPEEIALHPEITQPPADQSLAINPPRQFGPGEGSVIVTEARMSVPVPQALTILKERVDRDIAFDAKSGVFAFRLRSKVGETVIPAFIERAIRVERLVDFVEVLHKHEKTLKCESISLGRIVFTYGGSQSADAMNVGGRKVYNATVDFGSTDSLMTLEFGKGNPHLRIADHLTKVLNERQGLDGVAMLLTFTLPALRALDALEGAWTPLSAKGEALVFVRAVEWFVIRYNIFSADASSDPRKIMLEIRLQQRRGEPWFLVRRTDTRDREGDDIDTALKAVWTSSGKGWQGMRVNAVAQPAGMEELIGKLDEVMRAFASGVAAAVAEPGPATAPAQVKPPQRAPEAPMMAQRQQPTPSQSQSQSQGRHIPNQSQGRGLSSQNQGRNTPQQSQGQSQGRGNMVKRDIVEID
jgi:mediator of RNA polymerase II transcription subunit 14